MLLLHALLFLFFGIWAAALPVPGNLLYGKTRPAAGKEPDHNIHWNVPRALSQYF